MDQIELIPFTKPINARVELPGSKSITNRVLLLAALSEGRTVVKNAIFSDDSRYFVDALIKLGYDVKTDEREKQISITGQGHKIPSSSAELFIGNAGTAARFLTAFLTLGEGSFVIDGEPRMRERPIGDLIEGLKNLGVDINGTVNAKTGKVCPPVTIKANKLPGGRVAISGKTSSQYLSALLMVAPMAGDGMTLKITDQLNSRPYVDMTTGMMRKFGVSVTEIEEAEFEVKPQKYQSPGVYIVEPDASAASYFFALPALTGGSVHINGLDRSSIQGDINFTDILSSMGVNFTSTQDGMIASFDKEMPLKGVRVNMADIPDTAQTLAAIAPFASSPVEIRGIASARVKESDRVSATCDELRKLGVVVEEFEDGLRIHPCQDIKPEAIDTYNDHRMAMSFALIGTRIPGIKINDPDCVSKTFPNYFETLESMRP